MSRVAKLTTVDRQTFCLYCQKDFDKPGDLAWHIMKAHPNSYARRNVVRKVTVDR